MPPEYEVSPAQTWDKNAARRALDDLFSLARQYRSSRSYQELMTFIGRFRFYAPFNAMLIHMQMPGASYVAPPHRWIEEYRRRIRPGARPLVILQPMGPVMFVFDVSDTEPEENAPPLPQEVESPFAVRQGRIGKELSRTIENAKGDGIEVVERQAGSQSAGQIAVARQGRQLTVLIRRKPKPEFATVPLRYEILLSSSHSKEAKYATLVHELGHLYCGHLGTPDDKWWPDRRRLSHEHQELEAESICNLACMRLGIENPSAEYLAGYLPTNMDMPDISLDRVLTAVHLIEQMGRIRLGPRRAGFAGRSFPKRIDKQTATKVIKGGGDSSVGNVAPTMPLNPESANSAVQAQLDAALADLGQLLGKR